MYTFPFIQKYTRMCQQQMMRVRVMMRVMMRVRRVAAIAANMVYARSLSEILTCAEYFLSQQYFLLRLRQKSSTFCSGRGFGVYFSAKRRSVFAADVYLCYQKMYLVRRLQQPSGSCQTGTIF
jgi:hypothetical protein